MKLRVQEWTDAMVVFITACAIVFLVALSIFFVTGCTTVTPKPVTSPGPFVTGNEADSGIIRINPDHSMIVKQGFKAVFDDLIQIYGHDLVPPLKSDGLIAQPDGTFYCDEQHAIYESTLAGYKREGRLP